MLSWNYRLKSTAVTHRRQKPRPVSREPFNIDKVTYAIIIFFLTERGGHRVIRQRIAQLELAAEWVASSVRYIEH